MKNETENSIPTAGDNMETAAETETASTAALTPEQFEELKAKAAKADELYNRLLREAADFENYKKRVAREKQESIKFANESLLMKLVPIVDNFEMALAAASVPSSDPSVESLKKGIQMVYSLLKNTLSEAGLEEVDALHKPFDPNFHEAVSQQETTEVPDGQVVQQMRKGYKYRDRLLRPATVVVAKNP